MSPPLTLSAPLIVFVLPAALAAQAPWHPFLTVGPELLETSSPIPGPAPSRTTGIAPGLVLRLGMDYTPPGARWGLDLEGWRLTRAQHGADGCLDSAPDDCTLETQTRVTGVAVAARFAPSTRHWLQPYLRAGAGVYHLYHSEPTSLTFTRAGSRVARDTRTLTTPAIVAGMGMQAGRGPVHVLVDLTLIQYLDGSVRRRSLPVAVGLAL